jgi:hypothetical protein
MSQSIYSENFRTQPFWWDETAPPVFDDVSLSSAVGYYQLCGRFG